MDLSASCGLQVGRSGGRRDEPGLLDSARRPSWPPNLDSVSSGDDTQPFWLRRRMVFLKLNLQEEEEEEDAQDDHDKTSPDLSLRGSSVPSLYSPAQGDPSRTQHAPQRIGGWGHDPPPLSAWRLREQRVVVVFCRAVVIRCCRCCCRC